MKKTIKKIKKFFRVINSPEEFVSDKSIYKFLKVDLVFSFFAFFIFLALAIKLFTLSKESPDFIYFWSNIVLFLLYILIAGYLIFAYFRFKEEIKKRRDILLAHVTATPFTYLIILICYITFLLLY